MSLMHASLTIACLTITLAFVVVCAFWLARAKSDAVRALLALTLLQIPVVGLTFYAIYEQAYRQFVPVLLALVMVAFPFRLMFFRALADPGDWPRPPRFWMYFAPMVALLTIISSAPVYAVFVLVAVPYMTKSLAYTMEMNERWRQIRSDALGARLHLAYLLLAGVFFADLIPLFDWRWMPETVFLWAFRPLAGTFILLALIFYGLMMSTLLEPGPARKLPALVMSETELERLKRQILARIHGDQLYLKPQLRLADLSAATGIKEYKLSEVMARGLNTNFFDLINDLRVERAKALLRDPRFNHLNLLGIAADSGFNSKSAFNQVFKKKTGLTPSAYRGEAGKPAGVHVPVG